MERYPENTKVDIEDFRRSDWKSAIDSSSGRDDSSMWQSLSVAAKTAIGRGKVAEGTVLWLLADACSMRLNPSNVKEPFKPLIRQSPLPEGFQESDIALFSQIAEEIDDPWLQARLADLVWLLKKPPSPKHAILAIDAYRTIPLSVETWIRGGRECWERAISLTRSLGSGAGERVKELEAVIVTKFEAATADEGFLAYWLAELLATNRLGRDKGVDIARRLESLARSFDARGELRRAREFFAASSKWFRQAGDKDKAAEMTACLAEGWVKEAVAKTSSEQPSYMVAHSFYEKAIQTYRTIPRGERSNHRVDDRVGELCRHMSETGGKLLGELRAVTLPSIDISEIVESARNAVRGKTALDALAAFTNVYRAREKQIRKISEEALREDPFQALFPVTYVSRDGRVVAKLPRMGSGDDHSDEYQDAYQKIVWANMVEHYKTELSLVVQGRILPALEILLLEHRLRERDFVSIASMSPVVPGERELLFGKALFAGYEKDFVGALHLLVPQIEHMVRCRLKVAGAKTTNLDQGGIENENGLSALVYLPQVSQIFDDDVTFELKALFCDALGPNLRNELAHGLLGDEACQSVYSIYAWWFSLRLIFKTF